MSISILHRTALPHHRPLSRLCKRCYSLGSSKPPPLHPPPLSFTRADLTALTKLLLPAPCEPVSILPPHTLPSTVTPVPRESAVLIPLCNIGGVGVAHLLMEVRAAGLRVHASEAGFPGGKWEDGDENLVATALREAEEELGIVQDNVEVLGSLPPEYSLGNKARVWPIIGFVHPGDAVDAAVDDAVDPDHARKRPLPPISLSALRTDPGEVAALLPLPLSAVTDPSRQSPHYFRLDGRRPYWKVRCGDLVIPQPDEGDEGPEPLEIWGLSGWFLSRLAVRCGWTDTPDVSVAPTDD